MRILLKRRMVLISLRGKFFEMVSVVKWFYRFFGNLQIPPGLEKFIE